MPDALARLVGNALLALVDLALELVVPRAASASRSDAGPDAVEASPALPDSATLVARFRALRESGIALTTASVAAPVVAEPLAGPAVAGARVQTPPATDAAPATDADAARASHAENSGTVRSPQLEPAAPPPPASAATPQAHEAVPPQPVVKAEGAAHDGAADTPGSTPVAPAAHEPAAYASPARETPQAENPNASIDRAAFEALHLQPTPAPVLSERVEQLAVSPGKSGALDREELAAFLAARATEPHGPALAPASEALALSPARSGKIDVAELHALGLQPNRTDPLDAPWAGLPHSPLVAAPSASGASPTSHSQPSPGHTPPAQTSPSAGDSAATWPELPDWPLPWDAAVERHRSLRDRLENAWYV